MAAAGEEPPWKTTRCCSARPARRCRQSVLKTVWGGKGSRVPLSEDEQRILQQIEKNFYDSDPAFAREVSTTTLYRHAGRNVKWAAVGFVAGLVLLVLTFTESLVIASLGFAISLACAIVGERNLRKMGKAGLQSVTQRTGNLGEVLGDRSRKLKERFKREE